MYLDLISYFLGIISCFIIQKLYSIFFSQEPRIPNEIAEKTHTAEPIKYGEIVNFPSDVQPTKVSTGFSEKNRNFSSDKIPQPPPPQTTTTIAPASAIVKRPKPFDQRIHQPQIGLKEKGPGVDTKWEIIKKFRKPKEVASYKFPYSPARNIPKIENPENTLKENSEKTQEDDEHGEEGSQEVKDFQPNPEIENSDSLTDSTSLSEGEERLTSEEEEKVKIMIDHFQNLQCPGIPPTRTEAIKFLLSKNFLLDRSMKVSTSYAQVWNKYGVIKISEIAPVLKTGLIISPPNCHSKRNEQIMYIVARNIDFEKDQPEDRVRSLLFYLQRDLKSKEVQKNGFTLICDLEGAGVNPNIPSLRAMISLVQESIPGKARRIFIVNVGWVLRVALETTRMLLSHKLQKRVQVLKHTSILLDYIDKENLLSSLGGTLQYDHLKYIEEELEKEKMSSTK